MPKPVKKRKAAWEEMMKQSIFEATVAVMKKYGTAGIRMDRVAKAADLATGTLYNYFKDKDALLLHVIDTLSNPYYEELLSILNSDSNPTDKLGAYFRLTCRYLNEQRDLITLIIQAKDLGLKAAIGREPSMDRTITQFIAEIVKEGITTGDFRSCSVLETAAMIHGAMKGFIESKIAGLFSERPLEEDIENCMVLLLPGLLAAS